MTDADQPVRAAQRPPFWMAPAEHVASLGAVIVRLVAEFGEFTRFTGAVFRGILSTRSWARRERIGRQLFFVGTTSVPVLALTGGFIGMILAFEGYRQFQSIGQETRLGAVINLSVVKQIGPVLAAVMLAGRVGCALTAELGTMRVTEQLDAMKVMASDPVRVLVVPRFLACVLVIPLLTVISNVCGVLGGWLIITRFYGADPVPYERFSAQFINSYDIASGLIKSVFYGGGIGLIACWKGFSCKPGAQGVGEATTHSFVTSFVTIILMTLVLAKVLNDIDFMIHGGVDSVFR
ncbi:MAG TPA: ABC transporter permease [Phycisphaerales bacterium]|nr:ABC transporter permease [Phycisphaerales bacterium]